MNSQTNTKERKNNLASATLNLKEVNKVAKRKIDRYFNNNLPTSKEKAVEINDNFRLDCVEFDDYFDKYQLNKKIYNQEYIDNLVAFDEQKGIDFYNEKSEQEKKANVKSFVDNLGSVKHNLTHQIAINDKDFEVVSKEKKEDITTSQREFKLKLNDLRKKLKQEIAKLDAESFRACDPFEKELLGTNEKSKIKEILEREKQTRLDYINKKFEVTTNYYINIYDQQIENARLQNDKKIELANYECDFNIQKLTNKRDISIITEKIKARENYYLVNNSKEAIEYYKCLIVEFKEMVQKANEQGYLYDKESLGVKIKKGKFIEKELLNVVKNIVNLNNNCIDEYLVIEKDCFDALKLFYPLLDKLDNSKFTQNYEQVMTAVNNLVNQYISDNLELVDNLSIFAINNIEYVNYDLTAIHNEIKELEKNWSIEMQNELSKLNLDNIENIDCAEFAIMYKATLKEIYQINTSIFKKLKNIIKTLISNVKSFAENYAKENNIEVTKYTLSIDDNFNKVIVLNNDMAKEIENKYLSEITNLEKVITNVGNTVDKIGDDENKKYKSDCLNLENKRNDTINKYNKELQVVIRDFEKDKKNKLEENEKKHLKEIKKL